MKKKMKVLCVVLALVMSVATLSSCSVFGRRDNYYNSGYSRDSEYTRGDFTDAYGNYYAGGYYDRYGNFYPDDYYNYDYDDYEGYFDPYGEWHYNY